MHDPELKAKLDQLDVAALLMILVHLTADLTPLRGSIRRTFLTPLEQGAGGQGLIDGFTPDDAEDIRTRVLTLIEQGATPPRALSDDEIDEMIAFLTGGGNDSQTASLLRELAFEGPPAPAPIEGADTFPVAIVGAGQGGIAVAIRLAQLGIPYVLFEKNEGIGGTWFENAYPGVRVDVPGHTYSYSFAPNPDWSAYFPEGAEIRAYYEAVADRFDVTRHIRFHTEVVSAEWDEKDGRWSLVVRDGAGQEDHLTVRALVSAVGQLNRPRWPDIAGLEDFAGTLIHSAKWPQDQSLDGLRVGLIGSGATAFQLVPKLEAMAGHLTVFQRSPAWMFPNASYHSEVPDAQKWALRTLPHYSNWHRFTLLHAGFEGVYNETRVDPAWSSSSSISATNDMMRQGMTAHIASQVHDPALLDKIVPRYPPFGKRILQDEGSYLRALQSDKATLVTDRIARITPGGVVMADGTTHDLDVLVCATGFDAGRFLAPMAIRGRDGMLLSDQWRGTDSRAYLGITVPNFPNLFCVYGPNTNWVVAGSIVINAEYQASYIGHALAEVIRQKRKAIEVRNEVHDAYNVEIDTSNAQSAWGSGTVTNWYKNDMGRVTANMPLRPIDYWRRMQRFELSDYEIR